MTFETMRLQPILIDDQPHFVAMEVGRVLGYSENGSRFSSKLMSDWSDSFDNGNMPFVVTGELLAMLKEQLPSEVIGDRAKQLVLLNEEGLYIALMLAGGPVANRFRKWLVSGVLPLALRQSCPSANAEGPSAAPAIAQDDLAETVRLAVRAEIDALRPKTRSPVGIAKAVAEAHAAEVMFDQLLAWARTELGRSIVKITRTGPAPSIPKSCVGTVELDEHGRVTGLYLLAGSMALVSRAHGRHQYDLALRWLEAGLFERAAGWDGQRLNSGKWSKYIAGLGTRQVYKVGGARLQDWPAIV